MERELRQGSLRFVTPNADGSVTVTFTGTGTFYIGLKYDPKTVIGKVAPNPTTVVYTFETSGLPGRLTR